MLNTINKIGFIRYLVQQEPVCATFPVEFPPPRAFESRTRGYRITMREKKLNRDLIGKFLFLMKGGGYLEGAPTGGAEGKYL